MSEQNKRRFEVQSILRDAILKGLAATLPKDEASSWEVIEFGNPALVNTDGAVLMRYVRTTNAGWQWSTHIGPPSPTPEEETGDSLIDDESDVSDIISENDPRAGSPGEDANTAEHQTQIQHWQLSFIRKRTDETTDDDYVVSDVASNLASWFNGKGCEYLRLKNISNFRIDAAQIFEYNDNSDLYQKRVVFTLKLCVPKIIATYTQT